MDGLQHIEERFRVDLAHFVPGLLKVDACEGPDVLTVVDDEDVQGNSRSALDDITIG